MKKINKLFIMTFFLLSLMIVASCRANVYTISFELNGGMPQIEDIEVRVGEKVTQPANPTKEGHSFGGWFIDETFLQNYNFDTKVNNDYTLYAKWNINSYSIIFDSKGGTSVNSLTFNYNSKLKAPEAPTRTGYEFEGWYIDEQCQTKFDWDSTMPASNLTLYANWVANKYKVVYTSLGVEIPELEQLVEYNTITTKPADPTRRGYTFSGWLLNGQAYDFNSIITKSITLAASWTVNEYTITYNTNGGSAIEATKYDYNETIVRPTNPVKEGYTFAGWKLNDAVFDFTNAKMQDKNITLDAVWTANDYVISYNKNNVAATGTVVNTDIKYDATAIISANTYVLTGYTFAGWNTKADGTGTTYQAGAEVKNLATSGIYELYAIWTPNTYKVTFNANGGTGEMAEQSFTFGISKALSANEFTKVGYTFAGWATSANGTVEYNDAAFYNTSSGNATLYAIWKANTYTIVFNANGGTGTIDNLVVTYDQTINLTTNTFERTGYNFKGWALTANGEVAHLDHASVKNLVANGEVTLYAQWEQIEYTFTVYTDYTNNQFITVKYHYGDTIEAIENPTAQGKQFEGWFDAKGVAFTFENAKMPASDLTIYAKWENEIAITFETNGGSTVDTIIGFAGESYTKPVDPIKEGYTFAGWFSDQELTTEYELTEIIPASAITLYAKWTINKYTITYNSNGGNDIEAEQLDYNSNITATPIKEGYTFAGWFSDEELTLNITKVPADDTTIYAKWTVNKYSVSYDANEGTGTTLKQDVNYDSVFNLQNNNFSREGYTFDSWNTKADGTGTKYLAQAEVSKLSAENNAEIVLYAYWKPITYTIIFNNNNGTGEMDDLEVEYGQNVPLTKNTFTRVGYDFKGWATNAAATEIAFDDEAYIQNLTNQNGEFTLYAVWEMITYTVKFIGWKNKVEATIEVPFDENTFGGLDNIPQISKIGYDVTWTINGSKVEDDYPITSDIEIKAQFSKKTYNVQFVVDHKALYPLTGEYGSSYSFSEYVNELKARADFLYEIDLRLQNADYSIFYEFFSGNTPTEKFIKLQQYSPDSIAPLMAMLETGNINQDTISAFYTIINSDMTTANRLYNSYKTNNGNPSKEGYVFKGWALGENTWYEDEDGNIYKPGDLIYSISEEENAPKFQVIPANENAEETAVIIAVFSGVNPIEISLDDADSNKILWDEVTLADLGYNSELFDLEVRYEILNKINANEYVQVDVVYNQGSYTFLTPGTYSIPGELKLYIIATVTVINKSDNSTEVVLQSDYADNAFDHLVSLKENNLDVDTELSGDFYYRGTDPDSDLPTFYFFTNMTYDFNSTDFVITDINGNPASNPNITLAAAEGKENKSIIKTNNYTTAFYFKSTPTADKVFYAKVLPLVTSFNFGQELTHFNSTKDGKGLFLNSVNAVYQIGSANPNYSPENNTADYNNNGFEFRVEAKTSGGNNIDFKGLGYTDFLVYKFYKFNGTSYELVENPYDEENGMGAYRKETNAWEFRLSSGKYKVEISIKDTYIPLKYINDEIIEPLEFEFELNNKPNVFSHEVLKVVYNKTTSEEFQRGLNIHANITPVITEKQKFTEEAVAAGNPYISLFYPTVRDGSIVNIDPWQLVSTLTYQTTPEQARDFSGNVYTRVAASDLEENYVISGNLFTVNGEKLPYASIATGDLSSVSGYDIACQHSAIFFYSVSNLDPDYHKPGTSNSKITINDLNIIGNTTVPTLNSSSETELQTSIDIMNRNSGGYLGLNLFGGTSTEQNNTIINNTTIAIKGGNGPCGIDVNYFYSQSSWQSAIFTQTNGRDINIRNSHIKNCGGAAIHSEDKYSTRDQLIDSTVYIDNNTIIDNYVSGEEGYFKAYSLEFSVMLMKGQMSEGVTTFSTMMETTHTMLKTVEDPVTGLTSTKVNFIFLSIPTKDSVNSTGDNATLTGNVKFKTFVIADAKGQGMGEYTYDYSNTLNEMFQNSMMAYTKVDMSSGTPTEGVFMSCQNIGAMGNAFMVVGTYKE